MSQGLGPSYSPPEVLTQKMRGREKRGFLWGRRMGGRGWGLQIYRTIVHGRSPQFYGNNTERSGPVIPTEGKKKPLGSVHPPRVRCVYHVLENSVTHAWREKDVSEWEGRFPQRQTLAGRQRLPSPEGRQWPVWVCSWLPPAFPPPPCKKRRALLSPVQAGSRNEVTAKGCFACLQGGNISEKGSRLWNAQPFLPDLLFRRDGDKREAKETGPTFPNRRGVSLTLRGQDLGMPTCHFGNQAAGQCGVVCVYSERCVTDPALRTNKKLFRKYKHLRHVIKGDKGNTNLPGLPFSWAGRKLLSEPLCPEKLFLLCPPCPGTTKAGTGIPKVRLPPIDPWPPGPTSPADLRHCVTKQNARLGPL